MPQVQRPQAAAPRSAAYDQAIIAALGETGLPGAKEVIDFSFYDRKTFLTAATASQTYFATPGTDDLVSNFQGSGAMPAGQAFLVRALRVIPTPGQSLQDIVNVMTKMSIRFTVENAKLYAQGPVFNYPAGVGATVEQVPGTAAALGTGVGYGNTGVAALGNVYRFQKPVVLRPQQNFAITITPSTPTFVASQLLYVQIDGVFVRNVI